MGIIMGIMAMAAVKCHAIPWVMMIKNIIIELFAAPHRAIHDADWNGAKAMPGLYPYV